MNNLSKKEMVKEGFLKKLEKDLTKGNLSEIKPHIDHFINNNPEEEENIAKLLFNKKLLKSFNLITENENQLNKFKPKKLQYKG